ncbi:MAG TPA: FAD-dependent oxidoreductase [Tepidisphaeraceae bacterium]|jgi:hypothetical protein
MSPDPNLDGPDFPLRGFLPARPPHPRALLEPAREVPVLAEVDVAVFGGGPAGCCAAAAAARLGKRVLLVERYGFLGGMATAANVNWWHPLYGTDGRTKIMGGLVEEIIRRLQRRKACYNHSPDGETGNWIIDAEQTKFVFDDLVIGSGAQLLLHSWLAGVSVEGGKVQAAFIETKGGRSAIRADSFIDCTGDADLVRRAGAATQLGNEKGQCQPPSLCFRVGGRRAGATMKGMQAELFKEPMDYNGMPYPTFLWGSDGVNDRNEAMMAGVRVLNINASDPLDFTRAEVEGRYQLRWLLKKLKQMPGWESAYLVDIAAQIGVRESHRIIAEHMLQREEVLNGTPFSEAIAQGTYPIDIHRPDGPGIIFEYLDGTRRVVHGDGSTEMGRWDGQSTDAPKRTTLCYQVPYRSLVPRGLDNVLAAGRCIGAHHEAAGAIRVMVNAMQFGQAAGTAAALRSRQATMRDVPAAALRSKLIENGMPLR